MARANVPTITLDADNNSAPVPLTMLPQVMSAFLYGGKGSDGDMKQTTIPLLLAISGAGKTAMVNAIGKAASVPTSVINISTILEIETLPSRRKTPDGKEIWVNEPSVPNALQDVLFTDKPTLILLDELQTIVTASEAGIVTIRALINERLLHGMPLGANTYFAFAGNTGEATLNGLTYPELLPRMLLAVITPLTVVLPPIREWVKFARDTFHPDLHIAMDTIADNVTTFSDTVVAPRTMSLLSNTMYNLGTVGITDPLIVATTLTPMMPNIPAYVRSKVITDYLANPASLVLGEGAVQPHARDVEEVILNLTTPATKAVVVATLADEPIDILVEALTAIRMDIGKYPFSVDHPMTPDAWERAWFNTLEMLDIEDFSTEVREERQQAYNSANVLFTINDVIDTPIL